MSRSCRICLEDLKDEPDYHLRCIRKLFGTSKVPRIDIDESKITTAALAMIGHTTLSGIQKKISVSLAVNRGTLQVAAEGGRYILKPRTELYPALPENEHLTTRLAELLEIDVGKFGLVSLRDDSFAYIVRRFDRLPDGHKLRQEDFCQLAVKSPVDKYDSSAEQCVKLINDYATEPKIEILKFYRLLLFIWWSGNGDMHLKNFSMLTDQQGITHLTPAYDLLCTQLVIKNDPLALPIDGKQSNLKRSSWMRFATYCELPHRIADRVIDQQIAFLSIALPLIDRSFLPPDQKDQFKEIIATNTEILKSTDVNGS